MIADFFAAFPEESRSKLRDAVTRWKSLTDEQKRAEIERIDRADRARSERERDLRRAVRRERLWQLSGIEARFRTALLTDLDWSGNEPARSGAMRALETRSLWLFGTIGAGKTHVAAALVGDAIAHDTEGVMISGVAMLDRIRASYDDSGLVRPECVDVIGRLSRVPVLALDDLGKERFTPWAAERFYALIDARYSAKLPLIVTTNCTPRELEKHWAASGMDDAYGPALVRRIAEMTGAPVQMLGRRR